MIAKLVVYACRNCGSQNIVKNGHNASGSQQYWCKDCGKRGVLEPKHGYTEAEKEQILSAYSERSSVRGIQRTFGVSRLTLVSWLKKKTRPTQNLKRRSCLPSPKISWKPMKCVIRPRKMEQTLAVDSDVPSNSSNRGFRDRRSKRGNLSQTVGANPTRLPGLPKLQRFLGSLSTRLSC